MKRILFAVFFILLISCKSNQVTQKTVAPANMIKADVAYLADDKLEGRATGTEGEKLAAEYIANRFNEIGLSPRGTDGYFQKFTFKPKTNPHEKVTYTDESNDGTITGTNIAGYIDNKAPTTVVIGAHYDHLGYGGSGSLYRGEEKLIHNGADDNASGVAMLLNLAGRLKNTNKGNNYLFLSFSGEEIGLLGSNYFVKNATLPIDSINYMLNMDMVGRLKQDSTLAVYGVGTSPIFKQVIHAHNDRFKLIEKESGVGPSDHTSFYLVDVPVMHFFTGQHGDYHRPSDDTETINFEGMEVLSDYIFNIITDLDDNGKLAFRKTKNESDNAPRFKVTLGVVPDYMFDGKGMRIDGVSEDKPAQKAGLQKGDVVIQLGELPVTDMMSYMKALSKFEKGSTTTVKVQRGEEIIEKPVTF